MRLLSVIPKTITVSVKAPRPMQRSDLDIQMPAPKVTLEPETVLEVSEQSGMLVLAQRGAAGVIQVPDDALPEHMPALVTQARQIRLAHLQKLLNIYRMEQGKRQAENKELLMPSEHVRAALHESKRLKDKILVDDPDVKELQQGLPQTDEITKMAAAEVDAEMSELAEYGVNPKAASLMPGVAAWGDSLPF